MLTCDITMTHTDNDRPGTRKEMFPLKTLRHSQIAAKELQDKHSVGVVVVVTPAGYVVRSKGGKCEQWLETLPEGKRPAQCSV